MQGHRWRMIDLLELGDMDAVDIEIDAYMRIAARRRRLSDELYVHIYRAMRLLFAGEFDAGRAPRATMAARVGERVQDTNTGNATLLQALMYPPRARRARAARGPGPLLRRALRDDPRLALRARLAAGRDRPRPTRRARCSTRFAADDFRGLPLDGIWLGAVAYLAEAAAALGDATHAAALHDLLEPYADRNVAVGWASTCAGSASRHLGLLADLLGRRDEAIERLETALAMNERMRARPVGRPHADRPRRACSRRCRPTASAPPSCSSRASRRRAQLGMPRLIAERRARAGHGLTGSPAAALTSEHYAPSTSMQTTWTRSRID